MLDPFIQGATLVTLLIIGSVMLQPGAGVAIGHHLMPLAVPLVLLGMVWLLAKPILWMLKLVLEGYLIATGVKLSGVVRRLGKK